MRKSANGFTIIEVIFIATVVGIASIFFFIQKQNMATVATDNSKKVAINSMYYGLEEVFYPANGYYPQTIGSDNLKSVDPSLFTDPAGKLINTSGSTYSYRPLNCTDNKCRGYTLQTTLENENDFIKTSRNN